MTDPTDLPLQEPGATPDINTAELDALLDAGARGFQAKITGLDGRALEYLNTAELSREKPRAMILNAIAAQRESLEIDGDANLVGEVEGVSHANLGNRTDYSRTPAADIDRAALREPVLSADGWVLPLNTATEA